jgi:hypothetical protein
MMDAGLGVYSIVVTVREEGMLSMMDIEGSNIGDHKASIHQYVNGSITGFDFELISVSRRVGLNRGGEKHIIMSIPSFS